MKSLKWFFLIAMGFLIQCSTPKQVDSDFTSVYQVESGTPFRVIFTSYSTTLIADGKNETRLRLTIADSISREILSADDTIRVYVEGDGTVLSTIGDELPIHTDTSGIAYNECYLQNGVCHLLFRAGTTPGHVKIEAKSGPYWPGSHELHLLPADITILNPDQDQLPPTTKPIDRMIGADISFLPQIEERGMRFYDDSVETDAIKLLRDHGFNYIRLRIFVNPENEKGYSPEKGFCGLDYTLKMARRIKAEGMKFLLDFHYSDYWADPQQQNKPLAWADLDFDSLTVAMKDYTAMVIKTMEEQGTLPDMVQIGNEINHGLLWPDGHISQLDNLASLLKAGVEGVEMVDPGMPVMMHIALGGQNDESVFWLDNMIARGVRFDIIGISYYPRWHGTLDDLNFNLHDLVARYNKPINVVEYSNFKREVHDIVFSLPDNKGRGACIWEPLGRRSGMFNRNGETNDLILVYDELKEKYLEE